MGALLCLAAILLATSFAVLCLVASECECEVHRRRCWRRSLLPILRRRFSPAKLPPFHGLRRVTAQRHSSTSSLGQPTSWAIAMLTLRRLQGGCLCYFATIRASAGNTVFLFIHSFIHSFIDSSIHPFIHSFIHPFIHPSIHNPARFPTLAV